MRLCPVQIDAIKQETGSVFTAKVAVAMTHARAHGFTLVELITIMAIIGILAMAALPRFFDNNVFQERGTADQARAVLRYAQKVAIAQHRNVSVTISAAATANCDMLLVAGNISCVILDTVAVAPALPKTVTFNALGQPVPNAADIITVGATTINIDQETGYVR